MHKKQNNFAFIDGQNLIMAIRECGWALDIKRFRVYLEEKYSVTKAYIFLGFKEEQRVLYKSLQEKGYILIFRPVLKDKDGKVRKGNCDTELVLQAMIDKSEYDQAVLVTGDGDFYCLVAYLIKESKLSKLLIPNKDKYSALLKKFPSGFLAFVSEQRRKLEYKKEKNPRRTEP